MVRLVAALAGCLLFLLAPPARAWNAAGHRLVAAIAWRQLSPATRDRVVGLLLRHPDHGRWVAKAGDDPGYTAFLEASTWADDIRHDPRFYDETDDAPTPPLPGLADTARHRQWHYLDFRDDGSRREGELDRQIERLTRLLGNPAAPVSARAYALPWLIHLVGDGHQPLHVGSHDDEGGNRVEIDNPLNPRFPETNLHTWWDDLPGPPWLRGQRLERAAAAVAGSIPQAPEQGSVATWIAESRTLSRRAAYPPAGPGSRPVITSEFLEASRDLANRRLAEAGIRLGRLLDEIFAEVPRETTESHPGSR